MKIEIKTIPHRKQRYKTVGDWQFKRGKLVINVSDMNNWKYEFLVALHEQIETVLCKTRGISGKMVDDFDFNYDGDEPGDDPKAPYHKEHKFASKIEKMMAKELKVNWNNYDKTVLEI